MRLQQSSSSYAANPTYISLTRLLNRLEDKFPAGSQHAPTSRPSAFEMAKLKTNLEYANTLLQQLENDAAGFKNPSQRQTALSDLQSQRNTTRRLNDVVNALEQLEDKTVILVPDEQPAADEKTEEGRIATPVPMSTTPPRPTLVTPQSTIAPAAPTATISKEPASILRNRLNKLQDNEEKPELSLEDQLLNDRNEQEDLSESLLKMAEQLKANSLRFADDLDNEKDILNQAAEGLDKNTSGIQATAARMLTLKDGQDVTWWYQIKVMAALLGLALTAIIIFWLPKLRFGSFSI